VTYTIKLADLGSSETTLATAVPAGPVAKELNQPDAFSFLLDPLATEAAGAASWPIAKEIHVYRDATRIFAGPIMNAELSDGLLRFDCDGLLAYAGQRCIDSGADRENFLTNPEFEDSPDLTGWTAVNTTATVTTSQRVLGTKSAQLVQASSQQDSYLYQDIVVTGTGVGSLFTVAAWFQIDPAAWIGEAQGRRGLVLTRSAAGIQQSAGDSFIDGDTPRGSWQRAETSVWVPPNATETLQVRLYSPGGTIWWDAGSLTLMESLSSAEAPDDFLMEQTTIAQRIVEFIQDSTFGWDDLAITTSCAASGVDRERHYQFADHVNALQALVEFTELDNGFDIEITPARVFTTHYPMKGTDRSGAVTLKTPRPGDETGINCLLSRWRFDADQAASGIVVLGEGDGPDREEGSAVDPAAFGGRLVELVMTPRATTAIDTLDELATRSLVDHTNPIFMELTVTDTALVALLEVGDIVDVDVDFGAISVSGDWRIMNTAEDLDQETLHVTLRAMP
jgi:hypothetical protein